MMNNVTIMENGLKQAFNEEEYPLIVRYLRNISFNIEDYIRDSDIVLKESIKRQSLYYEQKQVKE